MCPLSILAIMFDAVVASQSEWLSPQSRSSRSGGSRSTPTPRRRGHRRRSSQLRQLHRDMSVSEFHIRKWLKVLQDRSLVLGTLDRQVTLRYQHRLLPSLRVDALNTM